MRKKMSVDKAVQKWRESRVFNYDFIFKKNSLDFLWFFFKKIIGMHADLTIINSIYLCI